MRSFRRFNRYAGYKARDISISPGPQARRERDEDPRVRAPVQRTQVGKRDCKTGIEDEAIPIDSGAGADRIQMFPSGNDDAALTADLGMVPEGIAFDGGSLPADRDPAAIAYLDLRPDSLVAEKRARIVAASDGVVAGRKLLEAEQRLPGILTAQSQSEGQLGNWPQLAVGGQP